MSDFILVEIFGVCSIRDGSIYPTETFRKNHDVSLRINEAQEDSIPFQKMGVSERRR